MDLDRILLLTAAISAVVGLARLLRARPLRLTPWLGVFAGLALLCLGGWLLFRPWAGRVAFAAWTLFVATPGLGLQLVQRLVGQQRYRAARFVARIIAVLHPADGLPQQPRLLGALAAAQQGRLDEAERLLEPHLRHRSKPARKASTVSEAAGAAEQAALADDGAETESPLARAARAQLLRSAARWDELKAHCEAPGTVDVNVALFHLRAVGECGERGRIGAAYERLAPHLPPNVLPMARLFTLAFLGARRDVERLLDGRLRALGADAQRYWRAIAAYCDDGDAAALREALAPLAASRDATTRAVALRRLAELDRLPTRARQPLDAVDAAIVAAVARHLDDEERFGTVRRRGAARPYATWILVALNLALFSVELAKGGATDEQALYHLGALFAPAVLAGEWWRLVTAMFLHFGWLHLGMNMVALAALGPFVERRLGRLRWLLLYLASGLAGGLVIVARAKLFPSSGADIMVGASGCIMGLVGATGGVLLRGWRGEGSTLARRRLFGVLAVVMLQTVFDLLTPEVSFTAHFSGVVVGFLIALAMKQR